MINKMILIFKKAFTYQDSVKLNKLFTVSNGLTILRIMLTPFIVISIVQNYWKLSFFIFLFAAFTDFLDGYFARKLNECTFLGVLLDPIADKILLISTFFSLMFVIVPRLQLPVWFLIFIIFRELVIVFGALIISWFGKYVRLQPSVWGKLNTFLQVVFILWYITCLFFKWFPVRTYYFVLALLFISSLFSLLHYIKRSY